MADTRVRRETERTLVAGSWEAVEPDNYRVKSDSEAEARAYITEIVGFRSSDVQLYAILRVRYQLLGPTVNRKGWRSLSPQTKKDYLASRGAQSEAAANNMTVPQWYAKAPDLRKRLIAAEALPWFADNHP